MNIEIRKAVVVKVLENEAEKQKVVLKREDGSRSKAISYSCFANKLRAGDEVLANFTANSLGLGTGGYDFIICNLSNPEVTRKSPGHIVKMPYTPFQHAVLSVEERESAFHDLFTQSNSLDGTPVIICSLHSHLVPATAVLKNAIPSLIVTYIMTDGAALPIGLSDTVRQLKNITIDHTVTCGNAYGGDFESVNIFSALLAAKHITEADVIITSMGPGIKGTETIYGHTGIEQGWIIDAVNTLGGIPVYCPRISFSDKRERHRGISHHSITVLTKIAKTCAEVVLPYIDEPDHKAYIESQISASKLDDKHKIIHQRASDTKTAIDSFGLKAHSMGRNFSDDPVFFEVAGAAALYAIARKNG